MIKSYIPHDPLGLGKHDQVVEHKKVSVLTMRCSRIGHIIVSDGSRPD